MPSSEFIEELNLAAIVSLKVRLAEKKAQVEGKSKEHDVQENEKKSHREM